MAEFESLPPVDPAEAAYREALLQEEGGATGAAREARRQRLLAALPRPEPEPVPVATDTLASRSGWPAWAGAMLAGLAVLGAVLTLQRQTAPAPTPAPQQVSERRAEPVAQPGSAATVIAAATVAPASRAAPPVVAQTDRAVRRRAPPPVLADASLPSAKALPPPPPPVPAAPVLAAAEVARVAEAPSREAPSAVTALAPAPNDLHPEVAAPAAAGVAPDPQSRLRAAIAAADLDAVRQALQAGAGVNRRDPLGRTPLMLAARAGAGPVVELLLAQGAQPGDRDARGWTAADHAQAAGRAELAERLRAAIP